MNIFNLVDDLSELNFDLEKAMTMANGLALDVFFDAGKIQARGADEKREAYYTRVCILVDYLRKLKAGMGKINMLVSAEISSDDNSTESVLYSPEELERKKAELRK